MEKFAVILMILCMVSIGYAGVIGDFECSTCYDGFKPINSPLSTLEPGQTTEGTVTLHDYSMKVTHNPTNYWPLQWESPTVPEKLTRLKLDLTLFAADWPTQPWTRFCEKIALQSDGAGGGWAEYLTTTDNWIDRNTGETAPVDWGAWDGDCIRTLTIDVSDYDLTDATWFSISFSFNCGTAGPYYIDNVHFIDEAYHPNPENGGVATIGVDTMLTWTNAVPTGLVETELWFGEAPSLTDPNFLPLEEKYKTFLTLLDTDTNPGPTGSYPMPTLTSGVEYMWTVISDPTDPNTYGIPFWTFTATDNEPPVANAGPDQYLWLGSDPNVVCTLSGSATDESVETLAYTWTQIAGPAVTIDSPNEAITTVTLTELASNTEDGTDVPYQFQLEADDGEWTDTDTVTVSLNSNSCTATVETPGGFYFYGDVTSPEEAGVRDCKVDLYDFAEVALNWLGCSNIYESCD